MSVYRVIVMQVWQHQLSHEVLTGLIDYVRATPGANIEVMTVPWNMDQIRNEGATWKVDGFIAPVISPSLYESICNFKWKTVSTHMGVSWPGIPQVDADHYATGVMAAEHFLDQGFEQFAYAGPVNFPAMALRQNGYSDRLRQSGFPVDKLGYKMILQTVHHRELTDWLKQLKKPCAIYCNEDMTAFLLNSACREIGLHVPDDIALLGTQDSREICEGMQPDLSSVHLPYRKIGYTAAQMLYEWMSQKKRPKTPPPFPPVNVTVRASTETLAVNDPQLKKAIRYIRDNCLKNELCIEDAARFAGLSLRDMQRKFKQKLGHPPTTELQLARIRHIKTLLHETDFSLEEIAWRCGYPSANYLCAQFKRITGMTPGEYRKTK